MKKTNALALSAIVAAGASVAQAQLPTDLVAGWDFSQFQFFGTTAAEGSTNPFLTANYTSSVSPAANFSAAAPFGEVYWDGQFGSTPTNFTTFTPGDTTVFGDVGQLFSNQTQSENTFNASSSFGLLSGTGQSNTTQSVLRVTDNESITIRAGNAGALNWTTFDFAADADVSADVEYFVSTDGAAFASVGADTIGAGDNPYTADLSSIVGASEIYIRLDFTNISGPTDAVNLDNFGVHAVPEPSTYAAIAGVIALAVAAYRRRRS